MLYDAKELKKREAKETAFVEALGNRIRVLRQKTGLNQDEFAYKAGIHRSHIGQIENAKLTPTVITLLRVADALDITLPELLEFDYGKR